MTTSQPLELLAPLSGVLLALDQVPDPVFSGRVIGDGLCIDPTSQTLCAPLAGVVSNIQDSGHAVSVTADNGVQILLHIGLDTVNLAGQGFTRLVEEGQRVEAGQPLIEFDADYVALNARSLLTLMLIVSGEPFVPLVAGQALVESGQPLLQVSPGQIPAEVDEEEGNALFSKPVTLPNASGGVCSGGEGVQFKHISAQANPERECQVACGDHGAADLPGRQRASERGGGRCRGGDPGAGGVVARRLWRDAAGSRRENQQARCVGVFGVRVARRLCVAGLGVRPGGPGG